MDKLTTARQNCNAAAERMNAAYDAVNLRGQQEDFDELHAARIASRIATQDMVAASHELHEYPDFDPATIAEIDGRDERNAKDAAALRDALGPENITKAQAAALTWEANLRD